MDYIYKCSEITKSYKIVNQAVTHVLKGLSLEIIRGEFLAIVGPSGVGKSTMAKIWHDEGALVIDDDRLIIRKMGDRFYIYNTPMFYVDKPKLVTIESCILYSPKFKAHKALRANTIVGNKLMELKDKKGNVWVKIITPQNQLRWISYNSIMEM